MRVQIFLPIKQVLKVLHDDFSTALFFAYKGVHLPPTRSHLFLAQSSQQSVTAELMQHCPLPGQFSPDGEGINPEGHTVRDTKEMKLFQNLQKFKIS